MLTLDRWIGFGAGADDPAAGLALAGALEWYDHVLSLLDRLHFIVPPTLLFLIWLERREVYYRCAATLVAVSFAGARDFSPSRGAALARVEAPLDPARRAHRLRRGRQLAGLDVEVVDRGAHPRNPVAAVPSLHAAYALLVLLFACAWRGAAGTLGRSLHARYVVHGRLPRRPLRRRHRRRRGLRDRRLAARPAAAARRPVRRLRGRFRRPSWSAPRSGAMFYARAHERRARPHHHRRRLRGY